MVRYLIYIDFFIWFLPLYKQYKNGFFYYFLVLALSPIAAMSSYYFFKIIPATTYVISTILTITALQYHKDKKIWSSIILLAITAPIIIYFNDFKVSTFMNVVLRGISIFYLSYFLLDYLYKNEVINLYFILLIVGELSTLFKMSMVLTDIKLGFYFYNFTSFFEYLLCIYFIFYNIKNSPGYTLHKNSSATIE